MNETATEDVGHVIADLLVRHSVVDLSLPLAESLPNTWPGHMPFRATVWTWFTDREDDPQPVHPQTGGSYQTRWLVMDEHTGTHLDAPRHFVPPPSSGLTGLADHGESAPVTAEHLEAWAEQNGPPQAGDVVLLRSDWDERYLPGPHGSRYGADALVSKTGPAWPAPTPEAVQWLHDRGVRCVGTDGLSIGPAQNGADTHLAGLTQGMTFVEALTGLRQLPPRGAWFLFLPLRLVDGTGAPGRALAVLPAR